PLQKQTVTVGSAPIIVTSTPAPTKSASVNPVIGAIETVGKDIVNAGNKATATAQTALTIIGIAASKASSKNPIVETGVQLINFDVGAAGEIENQGNTVNNVIGNVVGVKSTPVPFTPLNLTQQVGGYASQ